MNVIIDKTKFKNTDYPVLERALTYNIQRVENDSKANDWNYLIITDEGRLAPMRKTARQIRAINPVQSKYSYDYYYCYNDEYRDASLYQVMNKFFEKEYIGYRFIGGIIVPISDDYEVAAIEEGIACKFDFEKSIF